MVAELTPAGRVGLQLVRKNAWVPDDLAARLRGWSPKTELGRIVRECFAHLPAELAGELLDRITSCVVIESALAAVHKRWDDRLGLYVLDDYGVVSRKVITDAGVAYLVDAWQNVTEMENLKYHGIGTGGTAEAASQTALVTELTTEYNPNSTRATGTTTETSAPVFSSVGTNTLDSGTPAITEHGIFSQAATGGGTLWDRSLFSAINLTGASGDGLQTTYSCTVSSGG